MLKTLIPDRLFIGDMEGCTCPLPMFGSRVAARIHACKHPCHMGKVGQLQPSDTRYLGMEEYGDLFLNMIDSEKPLFQRQSFEYFLRFARDNWLEERPLVIHCNKGQSRSPTLALLFMAKCLQIIPDSSYDDAWDKFEETYGIYTPAAGIETWMRENWRSIDAKPLFYQGGTSKRKFVHYSPPDTSNITTEEAVALVQGSPVVHFSTMVKIEDKAHDRIVPVPNVLQMRIDEAYWLCQQAGIMPMLQVLKPRQVGCSTAVGHLCYHHARSHHVDGLIIGDESSRTIKVWQIFTEYSQWDKFPWNSTFKFDTKKASVTYSDGTVGQWEYDTANDPKAGISGTRQVIWYTEAARYSKSGTRTDVKVITASLASLAKTKNSLAVAESTAEGASGWFYNNWQQAVSIDDFKAGIHGNGWVKIFAAWFEFIEHTLPRLIHYEQYFHREYSGREKRGIQLYGWDESQIAWRRKTIEGECDGSEEIFDQDYPENDRDCFLQSGRPRFDDDGMTRLEMMADREHDMADTGTLSGDGLNVLFMPCNDNAWLWLREKPIPGCAYITFIDPCTGEQSRGAKNPDAHAAGVLRAAYMDDEKRIHPAALVACIDVPHGCRWDDSMVAERTVMMSNFFGGTMIVPETGNGLGVLVKLRDFHGNVFQRMKEDSFNPGKFMSVAGWETSSATRDLWVGSVADAIREQEKAFDCAYRPAVSEMRTFVINDRGKAEAAPGKHDDWVAGIGMGLYLLPRFGTTYRPMSAFPSLKSQPQNRRKGVFSY